MSLGQNLRKKLIFCLFILFFTTGFFVFPNSIFAEIKPEDVKDVSKIELKENDAKLIIRTLIQKLSNKWIEVASSAESSEKEAAVIVVRSGAKAKVAHYLMIDLPQEMGKDAIVATFKIAKLLLAQDLSDIINEIEKTTAEKAKSYLMELLVQDQIKISSGNMPVSYRNNSIGQWEKYSLPYIIAYKQLTDNQAYVAIGFYSSKTVKAPASVYDRQWTGGIDEIPPFILRVRGIVQGESGGYGWLGNPYIEVIFDQPVPYFDFPEPTLWQKVKNYFKSLVPGFGFFGANVGQELRSLGELNPGEDIFNDNVDSFITTDINNKDKTKDEKQPEVSNNDKEQKPEENQTDPPKLMTLDEIEKSLNDIAKQIDSLSKEISELSGSDSSEESDKDENSDKDNKEKPKEQPKTKTQPPQPHIIHIIGGGGSTPAIPNYCEKASGVEALMDKIIINEIAWMGTSTSSSNEWIELKNITEEEINLSDWQLLDKEKQIKIIFTDSDKIPANGFYLLERTDDNSVPDIKASHIYTGALNDSDETLYLFGNNCQLQDEVLAGPDWQAGEKEAKKTMERNVDLSWHTYFGDGANGIMGTPLAENSQEAVLISFNDSPWPMYQQNLGRTGEINYQGPLSQPAIQWVYSDGDSDNSFYTSPIIDDNGIIYSSITIPSEKSGILALNADGTKKLFEKKDISSYLMGVENKITADDKLSQAVASDGSFYYSSGDTLFAFDKNSIPKWQRKFEKNESDCLEANPNLTNPIIGKDGMIYVVVKNKNCNSYGDLEDYLYTITQENIMAPETAMAGFNTTALAVSSSGTVYAFNEHYGKYSIGTYGGLRKFSFGSLEWNFDLWEDSSSSPHSPLIIDSLGNIFLVYNKIVMGFDKGGNKIWELPIDNIPIGWDSSDIGIALSSDGTIYISGRGAIIAIK